MWNVRGVVVLVVLLALLAPVTDAFGQRGGRRGGGGSGGGMRGGGGGGGAPPRPDPNTNPTVIEDRKEISAVQAEMTKLAAQIEMASAALTREFEKTDDYLAARRAVDAANAHLAAAREAVLNGLKTKPDYKAAADKEMVAKRRVDDLKAKNSATDLIAATSRDQLSAGNVVSKLERDACTADPAYQDATKKQAEALAAMKTQKDLLAEKIKADKDISDLRTKQADAKTRLAELNKKLQQDFAAASQG